eukprot:CAMPEP_0181179646 /NCGR_PEP_ID=MMETSP1096-20121128/6374_1 /TAXON_ID=156174 ORGANISM="Chrysochromulina ericina, Strain CCMP281" /NCGR_SAMPLE_ID=MMETSP1096 /ASSEMBLY_ACC=CAM_ASM_000453 /LENGTH=63 /DNA_ID=CAMNT_0023268015 /DNA_START=999 /DNA_END=1190 /DNA_ORIENTATION=+
MSISLSKKGGTRARNSGGADGLRGAASGLDGINGADRLRGGAAGVDGTTGGTLSRHELVDSPR